MSQIGTFGMFTTARLGIYTAQQGLNLTGNNISNINTKGYTRQTLDIKSMVAGVNDRYSSSAVRVGNGAYASGISQMRDPYLDIRYRTECANVGQMDTKMTFLNDLAAILDEVGDGEDENGVISAQFSELFAAFENLTEYTGQGEFDTQVCASAEALVKLFNSYADRLQTVEKNAVNTLNDEISTINDLLSNIQTLSIHIRKGDVHGSPSLEMRDERNRLIDELSEHIKIDVSYEMEKIAPGVEIEKMIIKLADQSPDVYLVDGEYAAQLTLDEKMLEVNPQYDPKSTSTDDKYTRKYISAKDADGNPTAYTNDPAQALKVANTNYNLTLSALKDVKGNTKYTYTTAYPSQTVTGNGNSETFGNKTYDISTKLTELQQSGATRLSWVEDNGDGTANEFTLNMTTTNQVTSYTVSMAVRDYADETPLEDNALYGRLQATREFLTEEGEFATTGYINTVDATAATKRGVRYYQHALDLLANKFAETMNAANSGYLYSFDSKTEKYYYVDQNGAIINDANGQPMEKKAPEDLTEAEIQYLDSQNAAKADKSGNLFSTRNDNDDSNGITAANISISRSWASGAVQVVRSYETVLGTGDVATTNNSNILHFITLLNKDMDYAPSDLIDSAKTDTMFTGSYAEMLGNINAVLGRDQYSTQLKLDNYYTSALELDTNRDSVSSVDLNDETVNMIQYQKAYSAACRIMTTMDEILDKLINGTGTAGR